jgi:stage III sporulation protein AE
MLCTMKRAICLAALLILSLGFGGAVSAASPVEELTRQTAEELNTEPIETYWENLLQQYGGYFPERDPPSFMEMIVPGGEGVGFKSVLAGLARYFFHEVLFNGKLLVMIVVIAVFSLLLETIQSAFEHHNVSKVAFYVSYIVLLILAVNSFSVAIGYAKAAIESMIHFMVAMVPLLLTMLASLGNVVTVSVMHPLIIFMIHTVGTLIYTVVFPLLFFSAVLYIVSSVSEKYKVTQLAALLRNLAVGMLGACLTVFLGVISVQAASAAATDGIAIRTAKYVAGNFIPVVGRMLSDATDTVLGASLLVKNTIGLAGVIILILLCAFPAMKILALALIYNVSAAVMQPLGDNPIVTCLNTIGKSMLFVFAALASVSLMFFLAVTVLITAGNLTIMLR